MFSFYILQHKNVFINTHEKKNLTDYKNYDHEYSLLDDTINYSMRTTIIKQIKFNIRVMENKNSTNVRLQFLHYDNQKLNLYKQPIYLHPRKI